MGDLPALYTEKQAATYLGISPRTLARARALGDIEFGIVGENTIRYTAAQLVAYLNRSTSNCLQNVSLKLGTTGSSGDLMAFSMSAGTTPMLSKRSVSLLARETFQRGNSR